MPRFEAQADRWGDAARFVFVFSQEAHANAQGNDQLLRELDRLLASDKDGDGRVTQAEYGGSPLIFGSCDLDEDGAVASHEALSIRRIEEFAAVQTPKTIEERRTLARRLRTQLPGDIPMLIDTPDDATSRAYHGWPNAGFVLDTSCTISAKDQWAGEQWIERELARLTGRKAASIAARPIDWTVLETELAEASTNNMPLLVQLTARGCGACARMAVELQKPAAVAALRGVRIVQRDIAEDENWGLFEGFELSATPAFVLVDPSTRMVLRKTEGFRSAEELAGFVVP